MHHVKLIYQVMSIKHDRPQFREGFSLFARSIYPYHRLRTRTEERVYASMGFYRQHHHPKFKTLFVSLRYTHLSTEPATFDAFTRQACYRFGYSTELVNDVEGSLIDLPYTLEL